MSETPPAPAQSQKKQGFAWGALAWTAIGAGLALRALYHPYRAAVERGFATRCASDAGCGSPMLIQPESGSTIAYALSSGVAVFSKGGLSVVSDREPVIIGYGPSVAEPLVASGKTVGIGTPLAVVRAVELTVTEILRAPSGAVSFRSIEPASWLAARGLRIAAKGNAPGELWCTKGRKIVLPQKVSSCGSHIPEPSAALLLPVSVTMA